MSQQQNNDIQQHFYRASAADFGRIPGSPVAYWFSEVEIFSNIKIGDVSESGGRCKTHNDDRYVRFHWEVSNSKLGSFWKLYEKGGAFRKWYGNRLNVVNWSIAARDVYSSHGGLTQEKYWNRCAVTWSDITSSTNAFRLKDVDTEYSSVSPCLFSEQMDMTLSLVGFLNSNIANALIKIINPTLHANPGDIVKLPFIKLNSLLEVEQAIEFAKNDWDSQQISTGFSKLTFLQSTSNSKISECIDAAWAESQRNVDCLLELERKINQDVVSVCQELGVNFQYVDVSRSMISLSCNPYFIYGEEDKNLEHLYKCDLVYELLSYAIGCMMGRYSLDREGLVYAHAGNEGFKALVEEGAYATFAADDDGILPLTSENWFSDDVAARIEAFVATVWGKEPLEENLNFIADSLTLYAVKPAKKGGETARETIRRYLSTQFYKDHLKTYKKRPIYWLFSSGKEKAFECLVYLHRYSESTLPRMRTEYVTPLLGQMASRIERKRMEQTEASTAEAKRIGKEIDSLTKQLSELRAFDDQLKHHADMRITLDLDDGVKVNYGKFGTLLSDVKAITGDKGE